VTTTTARTRTGLLLEDVDLVLGDGDFSVTALDAVSMTVAPGELVAVVGPSGAGKSSLLAVAGGLTRPERVGFVFQSGNLIPALTAVDQLRYALRIAGRRGEAGRDPREMLEQVGMAHRAKSRPHQLSGGERQRVGIARALVTGPSVLLVDEPTSALDRTRSHEIVELLARETHEEGVATVMVTHDHDVLGHCDRVLQMVDGKLSAAR
jgi:putative ABC transport system ATP-binding protein